MHTRNIDIDKQIIKSCIKGDNNAQYTLYNKYSKAMYNLTYRMMNNTQEAEDMLQEAFVEIFSKLKTFRYESTIGAWIKKIVINRCINELRKNKKEFITDEVPNVIEEENSGRETDLSQDAVKVFKSIEKLPDGFRIVITLYLLEGYDHKEISDILDISESTSKSQYHRAKQKLKKQLEKENLSWIN